MNRMQALHRKRRITEKYLADDARAPHGDTANAWFCNFLESGGVQVPLA
jgi:hypothetical protein